MFLTRNRIYERNFFMKMVFVHDNSSPERCNFSEKEMIYKVLQDHVLGTGYIKENFFMKMVLYITYSSPERCNFSEKELIYKVL